MNFNHYLKELEALYGEEEILLHRPLLGSIEKFHLSKCIDGGYVSSAGEFIAQVENEIARALGSKYCVVTVNGTSSLRVVLHLLGVRSETEVITQGLTFVATGAAIRDLGAFPVFLDVDRDSMGLSPKALQRFLETSVVKRDGACINRHTGRQVKACVPMHTLGMPGRISEITEICTTYDLPVIEDAAEAYGSRVQGKALGTFGLAGILSFNGNKIVTAGGGGAVVTDDEELARDIRHVCTTAKVPHEYEFVHDRLGFNYRMPNLNAALLSAQLKRFSDIEMSKEYCFKRWHDFFSANEIDFILPWSKEVHWNKWLFGVIHKDEVSKNNFIENCLQKKIQVRPLWKPLPSLIPYRDCYADEQENAFWLYDRVVNIPSSPMEPI